MASKKMAEKLNYQVNREFFAAYLYKSMASYSDGLGLKGFANWFSVQAKEELDHAQIIYNYLYDIKEKVELLPIEAPEKNFSSLIDLFEKTLDHEKKVTTMIADLISLAKDEKDYATEVFLGWFISEQVEEENSAVQMIEKLELIKNSGAGILALDKELAKRTYKIAKPLED